MKKVCVIETEFHYEVVRNFVLSIVELAEFTIISNTFCEENLGAIPHHKVEFINYEKQSEVASEILARDGFDFKLTTTPPSYQFYKKHIDWFNGSDLLVHNMNYWFIPFQNVYFFKYPSFGNLKSFARFLKYLPSLLQRRKKYLNVFRSYIAPSEVLYQNYKQFSKLRTFIRLDYHGETLEKVEKDYLQIVIPGTVNSFRDYKSLFEVLRTLAQESKKLIKVYLLGVNQIGLNVEAYQDEGMEIATFEKVLSEDDFLSVLRSSDLGILPLKEEVGHMGILEKKGSSKISGGVNDLAYVGLKGLLPAFYQVENRDQFMTFSNFSEIHKCMTEFFNSEDLQARSNSNVEVIHQNLLVINS